MVSDYMLVIHVCTVGASRGSAPTVEGTQKYSGSCEEKNVVMMDRENVRGAWVVLVNRQNV